MNLSTEDRFWKYVQPEPMSGCWLWIGGLRGDGYGSFWDGTRNTQAHRFSYEHYVGAIPDSMQLDHTCRLRPCVNYRHVEPVTSLENTLRGMGLAAMNARKIICLRGHQAY